MSDVLLSLCVNYVQYVVDLYPSRCSGWQRMCHFEEAKRLRNPWCRKWISHIRSKWLGCRKWISPYSLRLQSKWRWNRFFWVKKSPYTLKRWETTKKIHIFWNKKAKCPMKIEFELDIIWMSKWGLIFCEKFSCDNWKKNLLLICLLGQIFWKNNDFVYIKCPCNVYFIKLDIIS